MSAQYNALKKRLRKAQCQEAVDAIVLDAKRTLDDEEFGQFVAKVFNRRRQIQRKDKP